MQRYEPKCGKERCPIPSGNVEKSFKIPSSASRDEWLPELNQFLLVYKYISGKIFMKIRSVVITWSSWPPGSKFPPPLPLLWKCCKVFLCTSSYSKTLSRRIIYAVFSQPVVGFRGLCPITGPMGRECNPGLEFSIPGFGIVEFPIPGSRDPVGIGAV